VLDGTEDETSLGVGCGSPCWLGESGFGDEGLDLGGGECGDGSEGLEGGWIEALDFVWFGWITEGLDYFGAVSGLFGRFEFGFGVFVIGFEGCEWYIDLWDGAVRYCEFKECCEGGD